MREVSVITAAHNAAAHIERNIRCVAAQTCPVLEHIIIDDGSTDQTARIVQNLQSDFDHVKLLSQANAGAGAARNAGIARARGRFVAFLDSDDQWANTKLEAQIGFMKSNGVAFSYGDYDIVDESTGAKLRRFESPEVTTYADLLRGCPIGCLTAAYDQRALGKRFMPTVRRGQDWGLWLELTREGTVARRYPGCLATYTYSDRSLSSRKLLKAMDIYEIYRGHGFGPIRACEYLLRHSFNAIGKKH